MRFIIYTVFVICIFFNAGCFQPRFEQGDLKPIPAFEAIRDSKGEVIILSHKELRHRLRQLVGKAPRIHIYDTSYILPQRAWLGSILDYQHYFMEDNHIHAANKKIESEFQAEFMIVFSSLADEKAGYEAQPAIGLITWLPIKDHPTWRDERQDVLVYDGAECLIVHPETDKIVPLKPFLKTHRIIDIEL